MCKVKEGKDVKTKGDLQNLVTSVILRQTSEFTVDDIYFKRIKHVHIHDNDGVHDSHLPLGEGIIDFKRFFEIFSKNNYDGIYNFELSSKEYIEKSIEYLKSLKLI